MSRRRAAWKRLALPALLLGLGSGGAGAEGEPQRLPAVGEVAGSLSCLSPREAELARLIFDYRKAHDLPPLTLSKSLTRVAKWHAYDLEVNRAAKTRDDNGQPCGVHSWSDRGGVHWTPLCYRSDPLRAEKMWAKPREVTERRYWGNGFENVYYNSDRQGMTPLRVLEVWQNHKEENEVMLQEGAFAMVPLSVMGVGISAHHAVVWFGDEPDPDGQVAACDEQPR